MKLHTKRMIAIFAYWLGILFTSLLLCVGVLWAGDAMADEIQPESRTYGIHTVSVHSRSGFNNVNPGMYVRWPSGAVVGGYLNSERRASLYAGWHLESEAHPFGLTAMIVTGYRDGIQVGIVPSVRMRLDERTSLRLVLVPKIKNSGAAAAHIVLEVTL